MRQVADGQTIDERLLGALQRQQSAQHGRLIRHLVTGNRQGVVFDGVSLVYLSSSFASWYLPAGIHMFLNASWHWQSFEVAVHSALFQFTRLYFLRSDQNALSAGWTGKPAVLRICAF